MASLCRSGPIVPAFLDATEQPGKGYNGLLLHLYSSSSNKRIVALKPTKAVDQ